MDKEMREDGVGVSPPPLTDEQLADAVPKTALVLERKGERNLVAMTRAELHEFAQAVRAIGLTALQAPSQQWVVVGWLSDRVCLDSEAYSSSAKPGFRPVYRPVTAPAGVPSTFNDQQEQPK